MSSQSSRLGCLIAIGIAVASAANADIYVSRDAKGQLVYSDRKPPGKAETVRVESRPTAANSGAESPSTSPGWEQAEATRKQKALAAEQERIASLEERTKRCTDARKLAASYAVNGPRCTYHADGGRSCLSAAEIDSKRADARRQLAQFCDQ